MPKPTKLAIAGEARLEKAREALTIDQILFAEWLATPTMERQPKTRDEFAKTIGMTPQTLSGWNKIPELWEVRDSFISTAGKEMVADALKVLKDRINDPDHKKLALEAARDVLDRWAEPKRHAHIIATIKDMYDRYQEN